MRRLIIWLFPFFVVGIITFNSISYFLVGAVITALFFIIYIKRCRFLGLFCIIFFILGFLIARIHTNQFDKKYVQLAKSKTYEGYILDKYDNTYIIKNYRSNYKVVLSSYKKINANPSDYMIFSGEIEAKPAYKRKIMNSEGLDAYIKNGNNDINVIKNNNILLYPIKLKYKINNALLAIDSEGGSFISGLVTGDTKELSQDTITNFQNLGLSHILAVSGFNVGIIFYFMLIITKKLNAKARYLLTLLICFIYTAIGGFSPSIFRAFIMISIVISAKFINRFYDITSGITLTALIMLLLNSFYIYNIGFLLSFIATYGIILLNKEIEDKVPKKLNKFKAEIAVSVAAFLATIPIMLWFKGSFSIISILINILISPIVGFATILSFLSALFYFIINLKIILYPSVFLGVLFIKIINSVSKFNIMAYPGSPSELFIILYYLLLSIYFGYIRIPLSKLKKRYLCIFLSLMLIILISHHNSSLKVHFINVGQGESIFIETPDRKAVLIDTGPKLENFSALRKRVIPYMNRLGYNSLDVLIFTHFHNDHAGDYPYLLDNYKVNKIIAFKNPSNTNYKFLEVSKDDIIKVGSVIIKVLYPKSFIGEVDDKNETCLVMEVSYKNFSMLLTGDAEKNIMDTIKGDYDVYNVQHHGSSLSFSSKMVDNSNIGIAVISVGKNNFGHPAKLVLNYLANKNIKTYRTDLDGNITVETNGENYQTLFQ
jgi:competence protein ComEC